MNNNKKILIAGIGNILKRDDGTGLFVIRKLKTLGIPKNVTVIELGTLGLSTLHYTKGYDKVIFIDAIKKGGHPGSVYKIEPHEIIDLADQPSLQNLSYMSMHELNLEKALSIGIKLNEIPKNSIIIGCEPEDIETFKIGLTNKVSEALPKIIDLIMKELEKI